MIRPILACIDPYTAAEEFAAAGWNIDFSQSIESGDPGCGVEIYMTVPAEQIPILLQQLK